ncbi:hypothetical protein QE152_g36547 [Popillia japonica]|uniref:Uncharacterized protein n=1 Tax=Popillia japonica TaxID=7064 RepID=A0AAW1ID41_POPJA
MPPGTRSNSDRNEDPGNIVNNVISFLKSDDFTEIECPNVLKSVSYADKVISTAGDQQKVSHQKMIFVHKKYQAQTKIQPYFNGRRPAKSFASKNDFCTQKVPGTDKNTTANNISETSSRITQDVESEAVNIDTSKTEGWSNVLKQKRRRNNKFITGSSNNSQIKTIPRKSFLFVSRIDPETDEKILKSHLVQFFKEAEVDELTSSHPEIYKSFKISIDQSNFDAALDPSKWPSGAYVTKFFRPRRLVQTQK